VASERGLLGRDVLGMPDATGKTLESTGTRLDRARRTFVQVSTVRRRMMRRYGGPRLQRGQSMANPPRARTAETNQPCVVGCDRLPQAAHLGTVDPGRRVLRPFSSCELTVAYSGSGDASKVRAKCRQMVSSEVRQKGDFGSVMPILLVRVRWGRAIGRVCKSEGAGSNPARSIRKIRFAGLSSARLPPSATAVQARCERTPEEIGIFS
jgi:hypothetical protein